MTASGADVLMLIVLVGIVLIGIVLIALARWARVRSAILSIRPGIDAVDFERALFAGELRRASQIMFLAALPQPMARAGWFLVIGVLFIVSLAIVGLGLVVMFK